MPDLERCVGVLPVEILGRGTERIGLRLPDAVDLHISFKLIDLVSLACLPGTTISPVATEN